MAESLQQAAYGIGQGLALPHQLGPSDQQHAQCLRIHAFDGHLAEPAGAHDLGEAERVVRIGLVDLHAQRSLGVTGIKADDG